MYKKNPNDNSNNDATLRVWISENTPGNVTQLNNSNEEKKKFICSNVRKLDHKDLIDLGRCISRLGAADKLKYGADGARINLDTLLEHTDIVVNQLYAQIKYKLEKQSNR